jgi:type I restriction enzyme, S subunit
MELKPGYKQTEVGVIPEEWSVERGADVTTLIGKGASPRWQGYHYSDHGMLFVTSENVRDGHLDVSEPKYLPLEFHEKLKRTKLETGDILINLVGASIGRSCQIARDLGDANVNQAVAVFRVRESDAGAYFAYCFQAPATVKRIMDMQVDAARPNISLTNLREFLLPVPPLPEQSAIVGALSDVDALLAALTQLIAKKRDLKQAAMQQLLTGHQRLPGFAGEWEETTLGQIGECVIGLTYKPEDVVEHGLLVLRASNVQNSQLAFEDNVYVGIDVPEHLYTRTGDILICVRNGSRALIGKCARIDEDATGLTFGAFMSVYRTKYSRFILHAFRANDIQRQIHENIGATINQITNKDLKAFRVKLPPEEEQNAIAAVLTDMDAELATLEQRLAKTRALKQGMMQELLAGRTRVV